MSLHVRRLFIVNKEDIIRYIWLTSWQIGSIMEHRENLICMDVEGVIMEIELNAFEVFEIAERIERNGAKFYSKAAELFDDAHLRVLFLQLSDWEIKHEEIFANMRKQLSEQSREFRTFRPENNLL